VQADLQFHAHYKIVQAVRESANRGVEMSVIKSRFLVLLAVLFTTSLTWAGDNDMQVPSVVSQVAITRGDAASLVVWEHAGRTELLVEHQDGSVDRVDVTKPYSPKLREHISWPAAVRPGSMTFVGALAIGVSCETCPTSAEADRDLVLLDSSSGTPRVAIRFDHLRDQKQNGDFLYVLTSTGVSIVRVRPEPDPVALASLYGG
jgi:hypothetical protein